MTPYEEEQINNVVKYYKKSIKYSKWAIITSIIAVICSIIGVILAYWPQIKALNEYLRDTQPLIH